MKCQHQVGVELGMMLVEELKPGKLSGAILLVGVVHTIGRE